MGRTLGLAGTVLAGAAAAVAIAAAGADAAPVVSGSQVRTFLGGATGKLVYTHLDNLTDNKTGRTLYYLDFSEEALVEHLVVDYHAAGTEPRNASISPDGQWVAYNTLRDARDVASLYIARLQTSAPTPISLGTGALPYWWSRPGTDEQYIISVDKDLENGGWFGTYRGSTGFPPYNAYTYCQQVNATTRQPVGSATQLMQYQSNGGRSRSGVWMFVAGGIPGTYRIDATAVANTQVYEMLDLSAIPSTDSDSLDGCNPSMSPHWPEADIRVLYLDKPHTGYHVCDVRGENRIHRGWGEQDNPYLDEPQWSTHPNFAAGKASLNDVQPPYDVYIFRISDGAKLKVIEGNNSFPYLWVEGSNATGQPRGAAAANAAAGITYARGRISLAGAGRGMLTVCDMRGRTVFGPKAVGDNAVPAALARGSYVAHLRDASGATVLRSSLLVR